MRSKKVIRNQMEVTSLYEPRDMIRNPDAVCEEDAVLVCVRAWYGQYIQDEYVVLTLCDQFFFPQNCRLCLINYINTNLRPQYQCFVYLKKGSASKKRQIKSIIKINQTQNYNDFFNENLPNNYLLSS